MVLVRVKRDGNVGAVSTKTLKNGGFDGWPEFGEDSKWSGKDLIADSLAGSPNGRPAGAAEAVTVPRWSNRILS